MPIDRQITTSLTPHQWNKRVISLINRCLREHGCEAEVDHVERAFETLHLFCVSEEAKTSLEVRMAEVPLTSIASMLLWPSQYCTQR